MNMKTKLVCLILALGLLLTACGSKPNSNDKTATEGERDTIRVSLEGDPDGLCAG